ncbi:hypothetical protein M407DRAFT_42960, partial [Tulasnella calospora MUT 4182]
VQRHDRELRGVGMQGFQYDMYYDEFISTATILSPNVGHLMRKHFPMRSQRSQQALRSTRPRFPVGIQEACFSNAVDYLKQYAYTGPVLLTVDDTKLLPGLRPFYDLARKLWVLVGNVGDPLEI